MKSCWYKYVGREVEPEPESEPEPELGDYPAPMPDYQLGLLLQREAAAALLIEEAQAEIERQELVREARRAVALERETALETIGRIVRARSAQLREAEEAEYRGWRVQARNAGYRVPPEDRRGHRSRVSAFGGSSDGDDSDSELSV